MSKKIRTEAVDYLFKAISGDCRQDRCIDRNDQPRKSIAELWQ